MIIVIDNLKSYIIDLRLKWLRVNLAHELKSPNFSLQHLSPSVRNQLIKKEAKKNQLTWPLVSFIQIFCNFTVIRDLNLSLLVYYIMFVGHKSCIKWLLKCVHLHEWEGHTQYIAYVRFYIRVTYGNDWWATGGL